MRASLVVLRVHIGRQAGRPVPQRKSDLGDTVQVFGRQAGINAVGVERDTEAQ